MIQDNEEGDRILLERAKTLLSGGAARRNLEIIFQWRSWGFGASALDHETALAWEWRIGPWLIRRYKPT